MELRRRGGGVVRVGHRGAAALAPENTLESFAAAVEVGVDVVEFDVVRAGDGDLAVAHEARSLGPTSPSLDEALEFLAGLGVGIHLDLKHPAEARRAAAALERHGVLDRSYVSSTSAAALRELAGATPGLARVISYPDDRLGISTRRGARPLVDAGARVLRAALPVRLARWARATGASGLSVDWRVVSPALAARCRALGLGLYAWTVNDAPLAASLARAGCDGIITDDPRILQGLSPDR